MKPIHFTRQLLRILPLGVILGAAIPPCGVAGELFRFGGSAKPLVDTSGIALFDWSNHRPYPAEANSFGWVYDDDTPVLKPVPPPGYVGMPVYAGVFARSTEPDLASQLEMSALEHGFQLMIRSPDQQEAARELTAFLAFKRSDWPGAPSSGKLEVVPGFEVDIQGVYTSWDSRYARLQIAVRNDGIWYLGQDISEETRRFKVRFDLSRMRFARWDPASQLHKPPTDYAVLPATLRDVEAVGFYMSVQKLACPWVLFRLPTKDTEEFPSVITVHHPEAP